MSSESSTPKPSRTKKWVAAAAITGALLGTTGVAMAQTSSSSSTTDSTTAAPAAPVDRSQAVHPGETLLTGDTATQVKAAAQKAVPDGTIDRVETDAEGSPYEAHITKSDGTHVTVKVGSDFSVTTVETDQGPGGPGGPHGAPPAGAQAPAGAPAAPSTSTSATA
jgi:hypothetical protein